MQHRIFSCRSRRTDTAVETSVPSTMDSDASTTSSIELSTSRLRSVPPVRKNAVPTSVGGASQDNAPAPTRAGKLRMPRRILFVSSSGVSSGTFRGTSVSSAAARSLTLGAARRPLGVAHALPIRSGASRRGGAQASAVHAYAHQARSSALRTIGIAAQATLLALQRRLRRAEGSALPGTLAGVRSQSQSMRQTSWHSDEL